jgi:hypothetical protein
VGKSGAIVKGWFALSGLEEELRVVGRISRVARNIALIAGEGRNVTQHITRTTKFESTDKSIVPFYDFKAIKLLKFVE